MSLQQWPFSVTAAVGSSSSPSLGLAKPASLDPLRDSGNGGKASTQRSRSQFCKVPSLSFWFSTTSWTKPPPSSDWIPTLQVLSSKRLGSNNPKPSPPHPLDHRDSSRFLQVSELNFQHFFNEFPYNKLSLLKYLYGFYFHLLIQGISRSALPKQGKQLLKDNMNLWKEKRWKVCAYHMHTHAVGICFSANTETTKMVALSTSSNNL